MHIFFLVLAAVVTLLLPPMVYAIDHGGAQAGPAAIGIPMLQILRAGPLLAGLLIPGRIGVLASIAGVVVMEAACCALHFLSMDFEMQPSAKIVFAVLATLLPVLLLTAGFLHARPFFLAIAGLSLCTGLALWAGYDRLAAPYREQRAKQLQAAEEMQERRTAELAALPENAPIESLLPFIAAAEPPSTSGAAAHRIQDASGHVAQLVAQLQTPRRLLALYALRPDMAALNEAQADACWRVAGELADLPAPSWADVEMLYKSTLSLIDKRNDWRPRHRAEAEAVWGAVHRAERKGTYRQGTRLLESHLSAK